MSVRRQDMQIGSVQIVVARMLETVMFVMPMIVVVVMTVSMPVTTMGMVVASQPGAQEVAPKAGHSDRDGLRKVDRDRAAEPHQALPADEKGDERETTALAKPARSPSFPFQW